MKQSEKESGEYYFRYLCSKGFKPLYRKGPDPPDFVFSYDDEKHAVEVTELHEYIEHNKKEIERLTILHSIDNICQKAAKKLGSELNRRINVVITYPLEKGYLSSLYKEIINYVNQGTNLEKKLFSKENCWISGEGQVPEITAYMAPSAKAIIPGTEKMSADIQANIDYAVKRVLDAKVPRLTVLKNFNKRVLIIYSNHLFGSADRVQDSINKNMEQIENIDKIFLLYKEEFIELKI